MTRLAGSPLSSLAIILLLMLAIWDKLFFPYKRGSTDFIAFSVAQSIKKEKEKETNFPFRFFLSPVVRKARVLFAILETRDDSGPACSRDLELM